MFTRRIKHGSSSFHSCITSKWERQADRGGVGGGERPSPNTSMRMKPPSRSAHQRSLLRPTDTKRPNVGSLFPQTQPRFPHSCLPDPPPPPPSPQSSSSRPLDTSRAAIGPSKPFQCARGEGAWRASQSRVANAEEQEGGPISGKWREEEVGAV